VSAPLPPSPTESESKPSNFPPSHIKIRPVFRAGERITTAEEFRAAIERVKTRCERISRYLEIRRELEGWVGHRDIYRLTGSLFYAAPDQASFCEKALMRITRKTAKDFAIVCIEAQRKKTKLTA